MRYALMMVALLLGGCQTVPVDRPCGVIEDDLRGVQATKRDGRQRLAVHFERGRAAGCWGR
jgi:hypothetical protein